MILISLKFLFFLCDFARDLKTEGSVVSGRGRLPLRVVSSKFFFTDIGLVNNRHQEPKIRKIKVAYLSTSIRIVHTSGGRS